MTPDTNRFSINNVDVGNMYVLLSNSTDQPTHDFTALNVPIVPENSSVPDSPTINTKDFNQKFYMLVRADHQHNYRDARTAPQVISWS